jgi:hypothetical protein
VTIPYVLLVYKEAYGIVESVSPDQPCSGKAVTRNRNAGAARRFKPPTAGGSSLRRQQFEERLRIAERIVQALNEAGHSCGLADKAYSLNGVDLPSRH